MSIHIDQLLLSKKVLLLQGPMGSFFKNFSDWLNGRNIQTFKINFNGGDSWFFPKDDQVFDYIESLDHFDIWLASFIQRYNIDAIVCFGDCRLQHQIAKRVCTQLNIDFFAFEEGYIRPNYITFERDGVNFCSKFNDLFSQNTEITAVPIEPIQETHNSYWLMVRCAILYYCASLYAASKFPHYQHHRNLSTLREAWSWIWSLIKRIQHYVTEPLAFKRLITQCSKEYYVFALQVHNDSQILTHSELKSMEEYIEYVVKSFALNANISHHLVLKHHPMDRGYRNYRKLIHRLKIQYGLKGRIHYFCDIHLPTLLKHSLGMVAVNSTTVLQALYHHIPVKVLGYAIYNLPRLTNQYPLSDFWTNSGEVDEEYFQYFRSHLIQYSQLNGAYYGKCPWFDCNKIGNVNKISNSINKLDKM